ncbi:kinase-like domain-containing protein [Aspergillus stella-maris]|uniref:kinase-like domain-containing protein n=1 Tax=Aspergillus stella-maris TaxID=1810926 RepID=UPI003CCCDF98
MSSLRTIPLRLRSPAWASRAYSIKVEEEPDYYQPGGFHRVHLSDTYNSGQSTILRKLGYGQYSTVWLARDSVHKKYVALKILRADSYSDSDSSKDIFESEILSKASEIFSQSSHRGSHHVSHRLDQFTHTGPIGDHVCFAFDVLGYHLGFQTVQFLDGRLPVRAVKVIARQLLLALDFLHEEVGVIHTDLKPTNILLEQQDPEETIQNYQSDVPVRTSTDPQSSGNAIPLREAITTPLIRYPSSSNRLRRRTHNLSESGLIQPPALRATEVTIGAPWNTCVSWSLGCILVELVQGFVLFSGEASQHGTWTAEGDRLARIIEVLSAFPRDFIKTGKRARYFFDEEGTLHRIPCLKPTSLERLLNGKTKRFLGQLM